MLCTTSCVVRHSFFRPFAWSSSSRARFLRKTANSYNRGADVSHAVCSTRCYSHIDSEVTDLGGCNALLQSVEHCSNANLSHHVSKSRTLPSRGRPKHTSEASTSCTCFDISGPLMGPFCGSAGAMPGVEPTAGAGPVGLSPGALGGGAVPADGTFVTPLPLFCESSSVAELWLAFMTLSGTLLIRSRGGGR
jgi:hypothetical protein